MTIQWWCSATTEAWTWTPQAYPGIWMLLAIGLLGYVVALRRAGTGEGATHRAPPTSRQRAAFAGGYALLWLSLDWPVGPLAAGYLLSAHLVQYVVISLVAAPLIDYGMPAWMRNGLLGAAPLAPLRALVRRPFLAFVVFNAVMLLTHLPAVANGLKPSQLGSMAIDLAWIASALAFWWSLSGIATRESADAGFGRRFLLILGIKIAPIFLGAFFVLADFPIYRLYELAPRALPLSALEDQILAGLLVWMGTTPVLVLRLASAFFAWHAWEERRAGSL